MEIPQYIKTSVRYKDHAFLHLQKQQGVVSTQEKNDPNNIVFPLDFSNFEIIESPDKQFMVDQLARHINNYNYWDVTEIDPAFYNLYSIADNKPLWESPELKSAVGHLPIFKTIKKLCVFNLANQVYSNLNECEYFARTGNLTGLMYAHKLGFKSSLVCHYAAMSGNVDCVKYLQTNGCPSWDTVSCHHASKQGKLAMLQYLHENKRTFDEWTCFYAAENGHLDCLVYAVEHGCPINKQQCLKYTGQNNIIDYIDTLP